jgi:hypothetical protein
MDEYLTVSATRSSIETSMTSTGTSTRATSPLREAVSTEVYYMNNPIVSSALQQPMKSSLDMRNIDVLSTVNTMKQIFHPPLSSEGSYYAIHTMNNTLLIDEIGIRGLDAYLKDTGTSNTKDKANVEVRETDVNPHVLNSVIPAMPGLESFKLLTTSLSVCDPEFSSRDLNFGIRDEGHHLSQLVSTRQMQLGSAFTPTPVFYMPPSAVPPPDKQVHLWQLDELRLALGSDLVLCTTDDHPTMAVKTFDTTRELEYQTCLDFYLGMPTK